MAPVRLDDVAAVVLHRVRVPLLEPFVAAHGTETDREVTLVEVVGTDGRSGWGECDALARPTYTAEHAAGAWLRLRDDLVPKALAGRSIRTDDAPMAASALLAAALDLDLRRRGESLARSLQVAQAEVRPTVASSAAPTRAADRSTDDALRRDVPCTAVVGRQPSIDDLVARVDRRVAEGYGSIKLKIAPGWDVEPLRAVRERWPDLALAADANGAYAETDAAPGAVLRALDELGLDYLEQPLAADDLAALARLADALATPVALDESIGSAADLDEALAYGVRYVVNCKPARVGGPDEALAVVRRAMASDLSVFVGGLLELGVGRAFALAFAALAACDLPTDLGPSSRYVADDVTAPIDLVPGGRLAVPDGPGLGVAPRPVRLAAVTVERVELTP